MHYRRLRVNGSIDEVRGRWDGHVKVDKTCAVEGCDKRSGRRNLCSMHAKRMRLYGDVETVNPRGGFNRSTPESFWARVEVGEPGECWPFTGSVSDWGYGLLSFQGQHWFAHRLAYFLTHGELPEPLCLHHCDNPPCCNPDHLYAGDGSQNMRDMYDRGRGNRPTGTRHHMARLTIDEAKQVAAFYWAAPRGEQRVLPGAVQSIADEYGVSVDTVRRIAKRQKRQEATASSD